MLNKKELELKSIEYRKTILDIIYKSGAGHTAGSLSCIDILNVLYNNILEINPENFNSIDRNRYVQSKGHTVEALYAVLCDKNSVPIHLIGMDSNDYTLFELHLHCEKGVVSIEQSGQIIRRRTITEDIHHTGYKQLQSGVWDNQKYINPYMSALDNLNAVIQGTDVLKSDSESAYYVQSICSELIDRAKAL